MDGILQNVRQMTNHEHDPFVRRILKWASAYHNGQPEHGTEMLGTALRVNQGAETEDNSLDDSLGV